MTANPAASFVAETIYERLPDTVVTRVKEALLDYTGVAIAGTSEPCALLAAQYAQSQGFAQEAAVIGHGFKTSAESAAWVNGVIAHALDYDDTFANSVRYNMHPSVCIFPAIFALAQKYGLGGKKIIAAYAAGIEVTYRLGAMAGQLIPSRGWYPTPVLGAVGAAAACANLLGLGQEKSAMALGIAGSLAGGLKQNVGTMTKFLHAGNAARAGIVASCLAKSGFTAHANIFSGESNFLSVFTGGTHSNYGSALDSLGSSWGLINSGLAYKPYPCCRATHGGIDAVLKLRREHDLQSNEIESLTCTISPMLARLLPYTKPNKANQAKFSLPYCLAVALRRGKVALEDFTDSRIKSPSWQETAAKVVMKTPEDWGSGAVDLLTQVSIKLNGRPLELAARVKLPKGEPENPMSEHEMNRKFMDCAQPYYSQIKIERILDLLDHIEDQADTALFWELLTDSDRKNEKVEG
ncbi:MAG: MmgE/PrpD family protein [Bacillota bacterium]